MLPYWHQAVKPNAVSIMPQVAKMARFQVQIVEENKKTAASILVRRGLLFPSF
jgi:hypothetical protein